MKKSAHDLVRRRLKARLAITPMFALTYFKCFRLAPIILRLKREGMDIVNVGDPGSFAIYKLRR